MDVEESEEEEWFDSRPAAGATGHKTATNTTAVVIVRSSITFILMSLMKPL